MNRQLSQQVKDLRGKILTKANTDVIEWGQSHIFEGEYLKNKTRFKDARGFSEDCQEIFNRKPYEKLLQNWTTGFREWLGEIWAPSVIFDELRVIKQTDPYSYQHILTISVVGARLLEIWINSAPTVKRSFQALICHRLGKARFQQSLFLKKEELDEAEKRAILEQPLVGYVLNACYWGGSNHLCAKVALQHQEDRLGKGYPLGVQTNSLILDILYVVDRFDALISDRPFRYKKFTIRDAIDILQKDAVDGRFEQDVLRAFIDLLRDEKKKSYKELSLGTIGRPPKD